jgi:hypothetical protein
MTHSSGSLLLVSSALAALLGGGLGCDPVHSNAIDALGDEAPGVRRGPTHRPGQPCLLCHDGKPGDPGEFAVAGTVFVNPNDITPSNGASGADVLMTDASGAKYTATTNEVGNFFVTAGQWTPSYPMRVSITFNGKTIVMVSHIGRDGSCSSCHAYPVSSTSAGPVALGWPDGAVP